MKLGLLSSLLFCLILALMGCEAFSFIATGGSEKHPAVYTLDEELITLVMVEDPDNLFRDHNLKHLVAANMNLHIEDHESVETLIPQEELIAFIREQGNAYDDMAIDEIGAALGAEQVIYVRVLSLNVVVHGSVQRPIATADVKIIDTATGQRVWPEVPASWYAQRPNQTPPGYPVQTQLAYHQNHIGGQTTINVIYRELAEKLGRDSARLFFEWYELRASNDLQPNT